MNALVAAHIIFLGLWGGLVVTEIVFETQMFRGKLDEKAIAGLHRITDRFIELPVLVAVLVTGWLLWEQTGFDQQLLPKVLFGLGAVLANVICYIIVELRASEALRAGTAGQGGVRLRKLSIALAMTIAPGVLLAFAALFLGGQNIGWW